MSRIAKNDVNAALTKAAQNIKDAAGTDGITSRADMKTKLGTLSSTEKALSDIFFRFIDNRDFKTGARITAPDVDRALAYSKEHLLANYDVNHNGFSKSEIAKMSRTGQLAVQLAAETKGIKLPTPTPVSDLGKAINEAGKDADYISESDSTPTFVETDLNGGPITGDLIMNAFADQLKKSFDYDGTGVDMSKFTFETYSAADASTFLPDLATPSDPSDSFDVNNAAAWKKLGDVMSANLTDIHVIKVGPKDDTTGKLGEDQGAYEMFVVGKTADGKLAGVTFENVQT